MKPLTPGEPRQIGPYRIVASLGEGGMGRVVLGLAPDGRLVAVKQIHAQFAQDTGFRERFRREVATSRMVSGAYTAAVMDADPEDETPWLASVFVTGPSLREAVDALGPLPVDSVRQLASGLAAALTEIHRAGLIHRDLKPGNIILTGDGPRVIDFGIARAVEEAQELTGTGSIIGSPAFMSPEQAGSGQVTAASDVFSLGAILVMASTGRGPFTGASAPQTLYNVVHAEPDLSAVPAEIRQLAEPCLAKDPARRPVPEQILDFVGPIPLGVAPWPDPVHIRIQQQDAEVRAALALPWSPPPKPRRQRKSRSGLVIAGALVAVAALIGALFFVVQTVTSPQDPGDAAMPIAEALTLDRLRRVDACTVLDGRFTEDLGSLEPDSNPLSPDRCMFSGSNGLDFHLMLGEPMIFGGIGQANRTAEGLPLLRASVNSSCYAAVPVTGNPELYVLIHNSTSVGDKCAVADSALAIALTRLRTHEVDRADDPASVLPLDPCALPDAAVAAQNMNGATAAVRNLRVCRWTSENESLEVSVNRNLHVEKGNPVDLGNGITGRWTRMDCALAWTHRRLPDGDAEYLTVVLNGPDLDRGCERVRAVADSVLTRLPKR